MRIASAGHAVFAVTMIALGILGMIKGDYVSLWQPIPQHVTALAYVCALISLASGIGLLWQRTAAVAARMLLAYLLLWLLLLRLPGMFLSPTVEFWWAACKTGVMAAATWETPAKSTSPVQVLSGRRFMPTSMTTAFGLTMSALR